MSNVRTFVGYCKPYCRKDKVRLDIYDEHSETYHCPLCGVGCLSEELRRNSYAPDFHNQANPFVEFK